MNINLPQGTQPLTTQDRQSEDKTSLDVLIAGYVCIYEQESELYE